MQDVFVRHRCVHCHTAALHVFAWAQGLLWKVPSHCQPESLPCQVLAQYLWGCQAGAQPADQPHCAVCSEQRLWLQTPAPVSHTTGWQEVDGPVGCPGPSICPSVGGGHMSRWNRGSGAPAGLWAAVEEWTEAHTATAGRRRRTAREAARRPQPRGMWVLLRSEIIFKTCLGC